MKDSKFYLIGCSSGVAGADIHSGDGPIKIRNSEYLSRLTNLDVDYEWKAMVSASEAKDRSLDEMVAEPCLALAKAVLPLVQNEQSLCVVGGDHSCAIGTWSGVAEALKSKGDIGLIWFDAHMDSHTPETSESKLIHGMPLACLLGHGFSTLTSILHDQPKLKAENVCLIGVRSYESGEAEFLRRMNVRIFFMDEVKEKGFNAVAREAIAHVSRHTVGYGLSLDIDGIDPNDAPGVDVPEADGVSAEDFCVGLKTLVADPRLIATEVVEFDPTRDVDHKTEKLVTDILGIIATGSTKA